MKLLQSVQAARKWRQAIPPRAPVIFVPTMGALHEGHLSLVRHARKLAAASRGGKVLASIYVNPTQFNNASDLENYPRPVERDVEALYDEKVHAVFVPSTESIYRENHSVWVDELRLSRHLEGASRPGHFKGVCTVVAKLFNILQPTAAIFGDKDFQQLAIVRQMVLDLDFPVKIVARPTVREPDGLAMSSRNSNLNASQRRQAPALHKAIAAGVHAARTAPLATSKVKKLIAKEIVRNAPDARVDYVEIADARTLQPLPPSATVPASAGVRILAAIWLGDTRLIDNAGV